MARYRMPGSISYVFSIRLCTMNLPAGGEQFAPRQRILYEEEKPGLRIEPMRTGSTVTGNEKRSISRLRINREGSHRVMASPRQLRIEGFVDRTLIGRGK